MVSICVKKFELKNLSEFKINEMENVENLRKNNDLSWKFELEI